MTGPNALYKAFLVSLLGSFVCVLQGQTGSPGPESTAHQARPPQSAISSATRDGIFRIDVAVTDGAGRRVSGLTARDFTLLDNGQPTRIFTLQPSTAPEAVSNGLPELIFVLDTVNLSPQQLIRTEAALTDFLRKDDGRLEQPCLLYRFSAAGMSSSSKATQDGNLLADELEHHMAQRVVWRADQRRVEGPHELWDVGSHPNLLSIRALGSIAIDQREVAGRKVVVWIGPGWPVQYGDNSFDELTELSTRLREARITVENVSLWSNPDPSFDYRDHLPAPLSQKDMQPAKLALPVIATHTGGLVLGAPGDRDRDNLEEAIEECAADARSSYTLTFDPPHTYRMDEYHNLHIEVARPGVTARALTGYYNEPVFWDNPRPGIEKVTVAQLEDLVHGNADLGHRLANLELTERLSTPRLDALLAVVHGERERQALVTAADLSMALAPPVNEIVKQPAPEIPEQRAIMRRTVDYLRTAIPKLPDFYALRNTVRYEEPPLRDNETWKIPPRDQTLRFAASEHATVLYRNGDEVVDKKQKLVKHQVTGARARDLETRGTFGAILAYILAAAANNKSTLTWKRWERGKNGSLAVFYYSVPSTNLLHEVTYCCLPQGDGTALYHNRTGAYGEFAVNPDTGAIMRIVIAADLDEDRDPFAPLVRSQVMVEYGSQELGGKTYICPKRSVAISRGRTVRQLHEWAMTFSVYSYFENMINDVTFGGYHKFGTESRILTGFGEVPETPPAAPSSKAH